MGKRPYQKPTLTGYAAEQPRRFTYYEPVPFSEDVTTEKGERVFKTLRVEFIPLVGRSIERVITCGPEIGVTEEWIEDTITGLQEALEKDYPHDVYEVHRLRPNWIRFVYAGARGAVQ